MKTDILLTRYITGNCSSEEMQEVEEWLQQDPKHTRYYEEWLAVWNESGKIRHTHTVNEHEAWERFRAALPDQLPQKTVLPWMRIAAIFIWVICGTGLFLWVRSSLKTQEISIESGNSARTEVLPDGSVVTLDRHSAIFYPAVFNESHRSVVLKGDAFFTIAPNARRPFVIKVNDIDIKVIGTSFTVRSSLSSTMVDVRSGLVKLLKGTDSTLLEPDETINVPANDTLPMKYYILKKMESEKVLQFLRETKQDLINADTVQLKTGADQDDSALIKKKIKLFNALKNRGIDSIYFSGSAISLNNLMKQALRDDNKITPDSRDTVALEQQQSHDIVRSIIKELTDHNIVNNKADIVSFHLTAEELFVNGTKQPQPVFQKLRDAFISSRQDYGIFYGADKKTTRFGFHVAKENL